MHCKFVVGSVKRGNVALLRKQRYGSKQNMKYNPKTLLSLTLLYTGEGHPPSYQSSVEQKDGDSVSLQLSEIKQKIADLEATMRKNSQEMHCMQQDLASSFQKQLGALRKPFVNEEGFQQDIQQGQLCTKKAAVND